MAAQNPFGSPAPPASNAPLQRGRVTRLEAVTGHAFVEVVKGSAGSEYGPLPLPVGVAVSPGDSVLVGSVGGQVDDVVLIATYGQ